MGAARGHGRANGVLDGQVMTESAAITLYDHRRHRPSCAGAQEAIRADFLRRLIFNVANLYPTFTCMSTTLLAALSPTSSAQWGFVASVSAYREQLGLKASPERRALCCAVHCARHLPRRYSASGPPNWFAANCATYDRAAKTRREPRLAAVWRRNFPQGERSCRFHDRFGLPLTTASAAANRPMLGKHEGR